MYKIKWISQAIAQPCEVQKSLFPDFVNVADELAIEWETALEELNDHNIITLLTDEQKAVIKKLDEYMLSISGEANIQYWNNDALCKCVEWQNMREIAMNILTIMDWEKTAPPKSNAIYIKNN